MVVSNPIGHCVDHAHYLSTVPQMIVSSANLLMLIQAQRTCSTAQRVGYRQD